jgi:transcriptional regulator with XRE-family HTH domain
VTDFGNLIKQLRKEQNLTLDRVARKIGSQKGYVSGIENGKVNPPSVKIIREFARLFRKDAKKLVWIAWADKAPKMIRKEARQLVAQFLLRKQFESDPADPDIGVAPEGGCEAGGRSG